MKKCTITVEDAVKKLKSNEYSVDFIAQRSDEQWSDEQKVNLLDSIFCGIVLPNMVIVQCEGKDEVIDGKQRLTTLKNYINNLFALPKDVVAAYEDVADDNEILFKGLSDELKDIILKAEIDITYYKDCTREEAILLFNRYNSGTPLSKAQKAKVYVENDYNIELVRVLLQHSSVVTTQRYIGIQQKQVEDALAGTVVNLV